MSKPVVAVRCVYFPETVILAPIAQSDRGTRYFVPGSMQIPKMADGQIDRTELDRCLPLVLRRPVAAS